MASSSNRVEQALIELFEAYAAVEASAEEKVGGDREVFAQTIIEELEPALEAAVEDTDLRTNSIATMLTSLSDALESIDPAAFEASEDDEEEYSYRDNDYDDEDLLDLDEEEEE